MERNFGTFLDEILVHTQVSKKSIHTFANEKNLSDNGERYLCLICPTGSGGCDLAIYSAPYECSTDCDDPVDSAVQTHQTQKPLQISPLVHSQDRDGGGGRNMAWRADPCISEFENFERFRNDCWLTPSLWGSVLAKVEHCRPPASSVMAENGFCNPLWL